MYEILLYYKYIPVDNPQQLKIEQEKLCKEWSLKGRIIIAQEGINGTVEGLRESTQAYIDAMMRNDLFSDIHFKRSNGTGSAFPRLSVKVRPEIVSGHLGSDDFSPTEITGKYLTAEELHEWLRSKKEFYIVDMRNDYEHKVGYFENSIFAPLSNFRDLPNVLSRLNHLKEKTIVTVCTGGVRCEKASGFLVKHGFKDVHQLYGGIVTYMEKYPNQDFKGKLYVFDGRIVMGFNTDAPEHEVVGICDKCGKKSDNYVDCTYLHCKGHRHFICCPRCIKKYQGIFCSPECQVKSGSSLSK